MVEVEAVENLGLLINSFKKTTHKNNHKYSINSFIISALFTFQGTFLNHHIMFWTQDPKATSDLQSEVMYSTSAL